MTENDEYIIALDLGGTNSVFGVVDRIGKILETTSISSIGYTSAESYVSECLKVINPFLSKYGSKIKGIGIGAPDVNQYKKTIEYATNLPWAHDKVVPIAKMFSDQLNNFPVGITNDANAAAIGEKKFGIAKDFKNFIVLTLGTGIGSGIFIDNKLLLGSDSFAGELGHIKIIRENGRKCECGKNGCLESYCSANGVVKTAIEILNDNPNEKSILRNIKNLNSYEISKAAENGDSLAKKVFEETGKKIGWACADFAAFSSPEAFIFFGGLTGAGDLLMNPIVKYYNETVMPVFKNKPKFLVSGLDGTNAAILGAAAIGWENYDNK